jgi:large subunit ribosomal protein L23
MSAQTLLLKPALSEKAFAASKRFVYVFIVPKHANSLAVKEAVTSQFKVKVEAVRLSHSPAKPKRTVRQKGRRSVSGERSDYKKAYVSVAEGEVIPIFASDETKKSDAKENKRGKK